MLRVATSTSEMIVRAALAHELAVVMAVQDSAAAWLATNGIRQWSHPLPRHCWDSVARALSASEVFLCCHRATGHPVGTVRLKWSDPGLWPAAPEAAGYVHDLAVRQEWMGQGIGVLLIDWAATKARERGRRYLRLDCVAWNPSLRRYYEGLGFDCRGEVALGTYVAALYERQLCTSPSSKPHC